ncbi:MAG: RbsD/FucU family protein [Chloroflexota bacterium]
MLRTTLLHPGILHALATSGHGGIVLIADGNYPLASGAPPAAERVYLNLSPGLVSVTSVLDALLTAIPVEAAHVMAPADGSEPAIFTDFRRLLPSLSLQGLERFAFYDYARGPHVALAIATGDMRLYANILLTIGVRAAD